MWFSISNNSGSPVQMTRLTLHWPTSENGDLKEFLFGGQQIFDIQVATSPAVIPDAYPWKEGKEEFRILGAASTKTLEFRFDWGAAATGYNVTVIFDSGCSVGVSQ
jgi:hypothetical protein